MMIVKTTTGKNMGTPSVNWDLRTVTLVSMFKRKAT